jgi:hypothetical protein
VTRALGAERHDLLLPPRRRRPEPPISADQVGVEAPAGAPDLGSLFAAGPDGKVAGREIRWTRRRPVWLVGRAWPDAMFGTPAIKETSTLRRCCLAVGRFTESSHISRLSAAPRG